MENNEYKVDLLELNQHKQELAIKEFNAIVSSSTLSPISFLTNCTGFKKLRNRKTEPNISVLLSVAFTKISALAGLKSSTDIEFSQDITNMIFNIHSDLSIEEIYKAFELERHCVYEEKTQHYQLFNAEYVGEILKKYKKWKQQIKLEHNINTSIYKGNILPEITESQKKETMDNAIIRKFNEYLEKKEIEEPFVYIFDELYERQFIQNVSPTKPKIQLYFLQKLEEAKKEIAKELENSTSSLKSERVNFKKELEKIQNNVNSDLAQIRAKRIVLKEFFDKHRNLKTDFEAFIKNNLKN